MGGQVVPAEQCGAATPFLGLCVDAPDGGPGSCVAQNSPARVGGQAEGAQQCGRVGVECDAFLGGLSCTADDAGVGACRCERAAANQDICNTPLWDVRGVKHVAANTCGGAGLCTCGVNAACNPSGPTPECIPPGTCVGYYADPANCGAPGITCAAGMACGNADAGLGTAQCGCTSDLDCSVQGVGGGTYCLSRGCVCPNAQNTRCPAGTVCSSDPSGCCERGLDVRPNSCIPPVGGFASCAPPDARHPRRRVCYSTSVRTCCDRGCDADGRCIP
jgi:hypothetical protein